LPRRAKKTVTDLSYGLRRTWRRVHVATPSPYIVALLVTSICIFILGGGIYDLLEKPIALIPLRGRWEGTMDLLLSYSTSHASFE